MLICYCIGRDKNRGNIIIGPEPMYAKTDYVYVMHFDGGNIRNMSKVWELGLH